MNKLITEDDLCDWIWENKGVMYTRKYSNIYGNDLSKYEEGTLVCLTGYTNIIKIFFNNIINKFKNRIILITLETDGYELKEEYINHEKLIHWFTWNKSIKSDKITALPIGLNKDRHLDSMNEYLLNEKKEKNKLLAINLNVSSNAERNKLLELANVKWKSFSTNIENIKYKESYYKKSNIEGKILINVTSSECYKILSEYKYIVSPPGAGIDCHRTWEALYSKSIPIIISSTIDEIYEDLPVLIVKSWNEITEDLLKEKYEEIKKREYNLSKLYLKYWIDLIKEKQLEVKDKIHFITYGNDKFKSSKERIVEEAKEFGEFKSIRKYGPEDLPNDFVRSYKEILLMGRGGGYWIWRPLIILMALKDIEENDFLVYLDAGCKLNTNGKSRFKEYIRKLKESEYGIMSFQMSGKVGSGKLEKENNWTCKEIFKYFNIDPNSDIGESGQYLGGILIMRKNKHLIKILEEVVNVLKNDVNLFTDYYKKGQHKEFKENRHEQSITSIIRKIYGSVVIDGDETFVLPFGSKESLKYPIWSTRIRI